MSDTISELPSDHPIVIAWNDFKKSPEFENLRAWALDPSHVDGSLWEAFCKGWVSRQIMNESVATYDAK